MTKKQRAENLLPGGIPKWIRCYDNGGETADRFTVIFSHSQSFGNRGYYPVLIMNSYPFHPQGIGMHEEYPISGPGAIVEGMKPGQWPPKIGRKGNLGTRIRFEDLPADCRRLVMQDYCDYWSLLYDCDICGHRHIVGFEGDCREDKNRFEGCN